MAKLTQDSIFSLDDRGSAADAPQTARNSDLVGQTPGLKGSPIADIPGKYIEVRLSSLGKLSLPALIHVRNFTFGDAAELTDITRDNQDEVIANVLNRMVYEDVDMNLAHTQEAVEILFNIWGSFWGPTIEGPRYYIDDTLPQAERNAKENISVATIPIANIETTTLSPEVGEPIHITLDDHSYDLILPRLQTKTVAQRYVNAMFVRQDHEFHAVKKALERHETVDTDRVDAYRDYLKQRNIAYLTARRAQLIVSIDGEVIDEFETAIERIADIDLRVWGIYENTLQTHFQFGVNPNIRFECSIANKDITRRFLFRPMDFLPSVVPKEPERYSVSFG